MSDWSRRDLLIMSLAGGAAAATPFQTGDAWADAVKTGGWTGGGIRSHGSTLRPPLNYGPDFEHFEFADPNAPKGGVARVSASAAFDSFNPYIGRGVAPFHIQVLVVEQLMATNLDSTVEEYGLIAEWYEYAKDYSWSAFRLRDEARFHDGRQITVADVQKSFELLVTKGKPLYRKYYADVDTVIDEGDRIVRFKFKTTNNRELPKIMGQLDIFPAHYWADRDFGKPSLDPFPGSGGYRIGDFQAGRYVEFERVPDHWAADLPVNRGKHNFDILRFDIFRDRDSAFEAFKRGDIDYWRENSASRWATRYDFPAVERGDVVRDEVTQDGTQVIQYFAFNTRLDKFKDRRVREALSYAYDFEWTNKSLYFGQYARPYSFFQGDPSLMATGVPEGRELEYLEPHRDALPPELFAQPYENHVTDGSGRNRQGLRAASRLLRAAGCALRDGELYLPSGERFEIEFVTAQAQTERTVSPMLNNFKKLGVDARLRLVDPAQYVSRVQAFDFDMITNAMINSESPGNEQRDYWGTSAADSPASRNRSGLKNPVIDALIADLIVAPDREALEAVAKALDRVVLWERPGIMMLYSPTERLAYWKRLGRPDREPRRTLGFHYTWWVKPDA